MPFATAEAMKLDLNRRGRGYQVAGSVILILASMLAEALRKSNPRDALLSFFSIDSSSGWSLALTILLFLIVVPIVGYGAVEMLRRGRRIRANRLAPSPMTADSLGFELRDNTGRAAGSIDARSAVVYLRSFAEDTVTAESRSRGLNKFMSELTTEEEQLAAALKPVGPMVAIGRPGEELPELGAVRLYVGDDDWQNVVSKWLAHARLVVLRVAGNSQGFVWELTQAPRLVAPERLVLLLPLKRTVYEEFRNRMQHRFPRGLPDYQEKKALDWARRTGLMGLVYFEPDWTPRFVRIRPLLLTLETRNLVRAVLRSALRPVFAQLGVSSRSRWSLRGRLGPLGLANASTFQSTRRSVP